ncbi:hypothetical protein M2T82_03820 [Elizabethkingia ursingii]|uniref:hypothetical protein n=1 Tax=Elizabethkingia ursingii TaxID=1756150 RepID=UPI002010F543|nr:hypothetical protein [Elizabethkingia ursingii]MCL1667184.1 hypothetical protein [Elizabethkingia ursingii]
MLDKIQTKLLLKYPLLWNTKLIPMLVLGVVINAIYFLIGYMTGTVDFTETYQYNDDITFFTFSVIISILALIVWLVFYFRNNSFKAFYPKGNNSLFYEWIHTFIIVLSLSSFYFFFQWGKVSHQRSYYSYQDIVAKGNLITQMDYFIDAPFIEGDLDSLQMGLKKDGSRIKENGYFYKDSVTILGKKYHKNALINRVVQDRYYDKFASVNPEPNDAIMKKLLADRNEAEIKKKFQNYFALVKALKLKTNLTPERLLALNYHPETGYMEYQLINPMYPQDVEARVVAATGEKTYSNFYVEQALLKSNFTTLQEAHSRPIIEKEFVIFIFYFSLVLSFLIFAFRATSGRSWLIALVALGILNIVFGLFNAITGGETYMVIMLLTFGVIVAYLCSVFVNSKVKAHSGIFVCMFLFTFMWFVPAFCFLADQKDWFEIDKTTMFGYNFILVVISFFFLSKYIKRWRALPEQ